MYSQVCKLSGNDEEALNAISYAQIADPNVFIVDHNDRDQVRHTHTRRRLAAFNLLSEVLHGF